MRGNGNEKFRIYFGNNLTITYNIICEKHGVKINGIPTLRNIEFTGTCSDDHWDFTCNLCTSTVQYIINNDDLWFWIYNNMHICSYDNPVIKNEEL